MLYIDEDGEAWWLIMVIVAAVFATGNTSGDHSRYWTEMRANRRAKKYFGKYYGVDWNSQYWDRTYKKYMIIEDRYPQRIKKLTLC